MILVSYHNRLPGIRFSITSLDENILIFGSKAKKSFDPKPAFSTDKIYLGCVPAHTKYVFLRNLGRTVCNKTEWRVREVTDA